MVHTPLNNRIRSLAFRVHADVRVVLDHLAAEVSRDGHKGLLARLALCELGNAGVPQIVKAQLQARTLEGRTPSRAPRLNGLWRVYAVAVGVLSLDARRFARWEDLLVKGKLSGLWAGPPF